jgi:hypothetical protein
VKYGMISPEDLNLFQLADEPQQAFELLRDGLTKSYLQGDKQAIPPGEGPDIAKSVR